MSGKAFGWAREQLVSGGIVAKAVLLLIADYAREEAGRRGGPHEAFPSVSTLAAELQAHERTIQRAIRSLEDDGLIRRVGAATASGKTTSNVYILVFDDPRRSATPTPGAAPPLPLAQRHPPPGAAPPSTTLEPLKGTEDSLFDARALVEGAGSPDFEGLPGDKARRAEADRVEAAYRRLSDAWVSRQPGRVHDEKARMALSAAVAEGEDAELIETCALKFLAESPDAKPPRLPMLDGWIKGKRWRGFEPKEGSASEGEAAARPGFSAEGPADLVARVCAMKGRDWFRSWLAQCGWDETERAIVAPLRFTADTLARDLKPLLAELKITVTVRKADAA